MRNHEFRQILNTIPNLTGNQKRDLMVALKSEMNRTETETLIEDVKGDISCCPHCGSTSIKRWGRSSGLQRYKCKESECGSTFNALTGTPFARLRHRSKWMDNLEGMQIGLSITKMSKVLGISRSTAFRWRHRFLTAPTENKPLQVSGIVEADETFFLESFKGNQTIFNRPSRKRGGEGSKKSKDEKIAVLLVKDRSGKTTEYVLEEHTNAAIIEKLEPIVTKDSILCSDGASAYKKFANENDITHHRLIALDNNRVIGKEFHIQNVNGYTGRLKTWMKRFHGVGTAYLPNYLGWMRFLESGGSSEDKKGAMTLVLNASLE
jgi:transposase-like protein